MHLPVFLKWSSICSLVTLYGKLPTKRTYFFGECTLGDISVSAVLKLRTTVTSGKGGFSSFSTFCLSTLSFDLFLLAPSLIFPLGVLATFPAVLRFLLFLRDFCLGFSLGNELLCVEVNPRLEVVACKVNFGIWLVSSPPPAFATTKTKFESAQEKGTLWFSASGSSNMHMHSFIVATDLHFLPEASLRSLLHVCAKHRLWQNCPYVQVCLSHFWLPMW